MWILVQRHDAQASSSTLRPETLICFFLVFWPYLQHIYGCLRIIWYLYDVVYMLYVLLASFMSIKAMSYIIKIMGYLLWVYYYSDLEVSQSGYIIIQTWRCTWASWSTRLCVAQVCLFVFRELWFLMHQCFKQISRKVFWHNGVYILMFYVQVMKYK